MLGRIFGRRVASESAEARQFKASKEKESTQKEKEPTTPLCLSAEKEPPPGDFKTFLGSDCFKVFLGSDSGKPDNRIGWLGSGGKVILIDRFPVDISSSPLDLRQFSSLEKVGIFGFTEKIFLPSNVKKLSIKKNGLCGHLSIEAIGLEELEILGESTWQDIETLDMRDCPNFSKIGEDINVERIILKKECLEKETLLLTLNCHRKPVVVEIFDPQTQTKEEKNSRDLLKDWIKRNQDRVSTVSNSEGREVFLAQGGKTIIVDGRVYYSQTKEISLPKDEVGFVLFKGRVFSLPAISGFDLRFLRECLGIIFFLDNPDGPKELKGVRLGPEIKSVKIFTGIKAAEDCEMPGVLVVEASGVLEKIDLNHAPNLMVLRNVYGIEEIDISKCPKFMSFDGPSLSGLKRLIVSPDQMTGTNPNHFSPRYMERFKKDPDFKIIVSDKAEDMFSVPDDLRE